MEEVSTDVPADPRENLERARAKLKADLSRYIEVGKAHHWIEVGKAHRWSGPAALSGHTARPVYTDFQSELEPIPAPVSTPVPEPVPDPRDLMLTAMNATMIDMALQLEKLKKRVEELETAKAKEPEEVVLDEDDDLLSIAVWPSAPSPFSTPPVVATAPAAGTVRPSAGSMGLGKLADKYGVSRIDFYQFAMSTWLTKDAANNIVPISSHHMFEVVDAPYIGPGRKQTLVKERYQKVVIANFKSFKGIT